MGSKHCAVGPSTVLFLSVNTEGAGQGEPAVSCIAKAAFSLGSFSQGLVDHHLRSSSKWSGERAWKDIKCIFMNLTGDSSLKGTLPCTSRVLHVS